MGSRTYSGINTVKKRMKDGSVVIHRYHRVTNMKLIGEPGTDEFDTAYDVAQSLVKSSIELSVPPHYAMFRDIVRGFKASAEFDGLSFSTRRDYDRYLLLLQDEFGDMPIEALEDKGVRQEFLGLRDRFRRTPRKADFIMQVLRRSLSWAVDRGVLGVNHAQRPGKLYESDRSEFVWTDDDIQRFLAAAGPHLQLALVLAVNTGQRQGDLLSMEWDQYDGQAIRLTQSKTKTRVEVPVTSELKSHLDSTPRISNYILNSIKGRPWNQDNFRHQFEAVQRRAEIPDLHFHDLRGTTVTWLAEAGCTLEEVVAITGHSMTSAMAIVDKYMARTPALARNAIEKLENRAKTKLANRPANSANRNKK